MSIKSKSGTANRLPKLCFFLSIAFAVFGYGVAVGVYRIFPYKFIELAKAGFDELKVQSGIELPWYYRRIENDSTPLGSPDRAFPGLNLVTRIATDLELSADIITMDGKPLHRWSIDFHEMWPDPHHLETEVLPRGKPGTHIHGCIATDEGNLVFNFEHLGMLCIDPSGKVIWRLPYKTHHSLHRHDMGNLWVCGQRRRTQADPRFPGRAPPYDEYTILEVSPDKGEILNEWSIADILHLNGRAGLLQLWSHALTAPSEVDSLRLDDRLHLNDAEPFPSNLEEGFFESGDVIVSLRNINTVFVFNHTDLSIKYLSTGQVIHQHDPDFIDGETFSVFDNIVATPDGGIQSRIVVVSPRDNQFRVAYQGTKESPFLSPKMGKHQWLPNGNLLITESMRGRAFEVDAAGEVVWEYRNLVGEGIIGLVQEVQRLPRPVEDYWQNRTR